jgi:hypothetical protein
MTNPVYSKLKERRAQYYRQKKKIENPKTQFIHTDNELVNIFDNTILRNFRLHHEVNSSARKDNIEIDNYINDLDNFYRYSYGNIVTIIDDEERSVLKGVNLNLNLEIVNDSLTFEEELEKIFCDWELNDNDFNNDKEKYLYYQLKLILAFILDDDEKLNRYLGLCKKLNIKYDISFLDSLFKNNKTNFDKNHEFGNVKILCGPNPATPEDQKRYEKILDILNNKYSFDLGIYSALELDNFNQFKNNVDKDSHVITASHGSDGESIFYFNKKNLSRLIIKTSDFKNIFAKSNYLSTFFCSSEQMLNEKDNINHLVFSPSSGPEVIEIYLKCYLKGLNCGKSHYTSHQLGQIGIKYRCKAPNIFNYYKNGQLQ